MIIIILFFIMIGGHALFTTLMLMEWWGKRPKDLLKKDRLCMKWHQNYSAVLGQIQTRLILQFYMCYNFYSTDHCC